MRLSFRWLALAGFAACAGAMAFALYLEHFRGFEPCPMCIFQRVAMIAAGVVFLVAGVHAPAGRGRMAYTLLAALAAGAGAAIAARHVWLQHLPPDQVPSCGPTLDYLLEMMPLSQVVAYVLKGEGSCAKIDAAWLGLALPTWTLVAFIGLTLYALALTLLARVAGSEPRP
ncbi:MAG TPA: disulfide bond formation protein B [Candidatus Binatia bacterium]|nr:disulfide bond formation protein B [Candidatus Binatia bacterium]